METAINKITVFPTHFATFLCSLLPTACAILTVVPIASPTIITVSMCMTCDPIDTAVIPATLSNCPMINKSAMPYKVCKKYDNKYGSENKITFRNTLPVVRSRSMTTSPFSSIYLKISLYANKTFSIVSYFPKLFNTQILMMHLPYEASNIALALYITLLSYRLYNFSAV